VKHIIALGIEEAANVATHGLGLLASLALMPLMVALAMRSSDMGTVIGVTVFCVTLVAVYAASTMYHANLPGPRRQLWRRVDQAAVFLLIAGTYTPFALGPLRGPLGWTVLAMVWAAALTGASLKLLRRGAPSRFDNATYLAMGWVVLLIAEPLVARIGWSGMAWLAAGGITYTIGVGFLACQARVRWGHCAWHVFVLAGSACHAIAILNYGIGRG
jgi:hemolysin III